ncbi:putative Cobalamin (5'-phosphate) synthase [Roseovarius sp. 217]|nr:putative Cobalamin (5'-phosphate) synthase [Roseovarius sp. 217]
MGWRRAGTFGLLGGAGLAALVCAGFTTLAIALIARAKIGGQTGDILGATQQLAEIAVLISLLA